MIENELIENELAMDIVRLPAFFDNYIFVIGDRLSGQAAVVDPGDANVVLRYLYQANLKLSAILITHHHSDHIGGNRELIKAFPDADVYGSQYDQGRIPEQTATLKGGDRLTIFGHTADILFVPGHTQGHIAYYFPPETPDTPGNLFCGDTLFAGGCGRLREGKAHQLFQSLGQIRALPDDTQVWCAHEYTLKNLSFSLQVDPQNPDLKARYQTVKHQRRHNEATIPSLLLTEKQTNPFLRWDDPRIQDALHSKDSLQVFSTLREMRDLY